MSHPIAFLRPGRRHLLLSTALLSALAAGGLEAQEATIRGKVIEEMSGEPLAGATVDLHSVDDSLEVASRVTDGEGMFVFESMAPGSYSVSVSFIGMLDWSSPRFVLDIGLDLGTITMEVSPVLLEELRVAVERPSAIREIDRVVYDVREDVQAGGGSVRDLLQNLPSVTVGVDGSITLRGTPNVTIFVNGRPSALLRRSAATALEQMPARRVARVEVITNPSARFRPDGVGGIINIVLEDDAGVGLDGQAAAHLGNEGRYNGNARVTFGSDAYDGFASYSLRRSDAGSVYSTHRRTSSVGVPGIGLFEEAGSSRVDALSHTISGGTNLRFGESNTLEASGTYFRQTSAHSGASDLRVVQGPSLPAVNIRSDETNDEFEGEGEASLVFEHLIGGDEDHPLTVEGTYAGFREREALVFNQLAATPDARPDVDRLLIRKHGSQTELAVTYEAPLGEDAQLEAGYTGELIHEDIRYTNNSDPTRFLFDQDIHALYTTYGSSFEDLSFLAGLRAEAARISSHVAQPQGERIPNNYNKLFPSLHVAYQLGDARRLQASYSKRLNRPDADELNPNPEFTDPRNAEAGNASLLPEQVHSFELSFAREGGRSTFTQTVYYRHTYDAFTVVQEELPTGVLLTTVENLRTEDAAGFEALLSMTPSSRLSLDLTGDVFYHRIDARNLGFEGDRSVVTGNVRGVAVFRPIPTLRLQLNGFYLFPQITPQGRRRHIAYLNGGVEFAFLGGCGSLTVTGTDVFHSYRVTRTIDTADLLQDARIRRTGPALLIGVTWRFRKPEKESELLFEGVSVRR